MSTCQDSLPMKTAQQMAMDGDEPTSKYIINNYTTYTKFSPIETSPPLGSVPIIDIDGFVSSSKQDDQQINELTKLRSALTTWGCFQAVNHGLSASYLDSIRHAIKQFFKLPMEEKRKYLRETGSVEGYGNDITYSENQVQDWCDRLFLRILPEDQRKLKFWPENPSNFRETIDDYTKKIKLISVVIFEAMAKSLDLEDDCFSKHFTEQRDVLQGRHYKIRGVEGLQVLNDGSWYMVPVIHDALFVNLGDQMQIMSNGIFKSPVHRVVTNRDKARVSVAMFTEPEADKEIGLVDDLVNEKRPRVYKTVKDFAAFNHECFRKVLLLLMLCYDDTSMDPHRWKVDLSIDVKVKA
ncbi:hypothetical protein E3N88_41266 [Mikania micrantha]|uniref:Fe2OG dioxygenase domain-containing protein n=1 Tax=Mikania micrantha TaxID=192012 RepID=A0A5N6LQ21_9ASTR|nr:hypothetical protein E3N88_41266 [Mikania micrantha]